MMLQVTFKWFNRNQSVCVRVCVCARVRARPLALTKREKQCGKLLRIGQSRFLNLFGMSKIFFKYIYPQEPVLLLRVNFACIETE